MRTLKLRLSYDGKHYHGWQVQNNALAVQEVFQEALTKVLGTCPDIKGCSRTDSGVHALDYCVSLRTDHTIPAQRLVRALNHFLPADIAVLSCEDADDEFHARYSCTGKEYIYKIWNHPVRDPFGDGYMLHYWYDLDVDLLNEAAKHYIGSHDFTSFCTLDSRDKGDLTRTVTKAEVVREGNMVIFKVAADGFLYNMVRIMVGTLLRVAQGKFRPDDIPKILEAKDRAVAGPTAPPWGLYLNRVFYGGETDA